MEQRSSHVHKSLSELSKERPELKRRLLEQARDRLLNVAGAGTEANNQILTQRAEHDLGPWHTLPADRLPRTQFDAPEIS